MRISGAGVCMPHPSLDRSDPSLRPHSGQMLAASALENLLADLAAVSPDPERTSIEWDGQAYRLSVNGVQIPTLTRFDSAALAAFYVAACASLGRETADAILVGVRTGVHPTAHLELIS